MKIQHISFTSAPTQKTNVKENNSAQNKDTNVKTEPKQNISQEKKEVDAKENIKSQNNKVRNWSVGIGSVAALIILGVAGRKGAFGKNIQKALGGGKKCVNQNAERFEEELSQNIRKADEQISPAERNIPTETEKQPLSSTSEKEPIIENSEKVKSEPEVSAKQESSTDAEIKTETETKSAPKVEEDTLTEAEKIEINSKLDRTIPQISEDLMFVEPKSLDSFMHDIHVEEDFSKYKNCRVDYTFHHPMQSGGEAVIHRNAYHDVSIIVVSDKTGKELYTIRPNRRFRTFEEIMELGESKNLTPNEAFIYNSEHPIPTVDVRINDLNYYYEDGVLKRITKYVTPNDHYTYNANGHLDYINHFKNGQTNRLIYFEEGSNMPVKIKYYGQSLFGPIKTEILENGTVKEEIFDAKKIRNEK